jgi:hypothetical protein
VLITLDQVTSEMHVYPEPRCIDIGVGANHCINGILFLACNEH